MPKKPPLSDADEIAFKKAMQGVKPLAHTKIKPSLPPHSIKPRRKQPIEDETTHLFQFSDYETLPPVGSGDILEFSRSGIQDKTLRKMRTGQYNIEARLDLHGLRVTEAREILARFIMECCQQGIRCVLIIHGKGQPHQEPILKNKLNHWLRQTNDVLAFYSAKAKDGSTGALYVLLKGARR